MILAAIYNYLFPITSFQFLLPSGSTSPAHGSLPGRVTQIFVSGGSGPLVILPGWVVSHSEGSLVFCTHPSLPLLSSRGPVSPNESELMTSAHTSQHTCVPADQWHEEPKVTRSIESLFCLLIEALLPLELRRLGQQSSKSWKQTEMLPVRPWG